MALIADELLGIGRPAFGARACLRKSTGLSEDRNRAAALAQDDREHLSAARFARREVVDPDRHPANSSRGSSGFEQGEEGVL